MESSIGQHMRLVSLFSGIGAFEKGLERIGVPYELAGFSEIDKYTIQSYCAIHNIDESLNLGDVSQISNEDLPQNIDMITYGFPCQDISVAGHQKGITDNTRSGLLFEAERIIEHTKPKFAIAENVKNLVSKKFKDDFNALLDRLDSYGYNNYWQVLNAKDYGIPQNRERVFIVSIRKDIDVGTFEFPKPYDSGLRLKDLMEDEVEEKYYIDNERANELLERLKDGKKGTYPNVEDGPKVTSALSSREHRCSGWDDVVGTLCARDYKDPKVVADPLLVGGIGEKNFGKQYRQGNRIYDSNAVAMCLLSQPVGNAGGNSYLYIVEDKQTSNDLKLFTNLEGGKWDKIHESARRVYDEEGIAPTIPTCGGGNIEPKVQTNYRIRKLTPLECWRLMGFDDDDYWKARTRLEKVFYKGKDRSNSQMYKQAGNSIVVNVIEQIYQEMRKARLL